MRRSDFFINSNVGKAETLPPAAFTNEDFLEQELNTIFTKTWQFIPQRSTHELLDDSRSLKEQVARRGAQAPFSLFGKTLFVQRDWKGKLHCFPNVCTHAWHRLIEGAGRERTIICPQHGRQFDTAGRFLSQPGFSNLDDFPRREDHLRDLPVEVWGEFLFTCLGTPTAPFGKFLGEMKKSVAGLDVDRFKRHP